VWVNGIKLFLTHRGGFWLIRYHGIEYGKLIYRGDAYVTYISGKINKYTCNNGISHPLCDVSNVVGIEKVKLGYVERIINSEIVS
jgi:hypothetical protein